MSFQDLTFRFWNDSFCPHPDGSSGYLGALIRGHESSCLILWLKQFNGIYFRKEGEGVSLKGYFLPIATKRS